jgi:hypothetical protein
VRRRCAGGQSDHRDDKGGAILLFRRLCSVTLFVLLPAYGTRMRSSSQSGQESGGALLTLLLCVTWRRTSSADMPVRKCVPRLGSLSGVRSLLMFAFPRSQSLAQDNEVVLGSPVPRMGFHFIALTGIRIPEAMVVGDKRLLRIPNSQ